MFYNNKRNSMATLLQQKNCITALTNGAVSGNNSTNGSNNSTNKKDTAALLAAAATRHDIVTIPSSAVTTTISSGGGGGGNGNIESILSLTDNTGCFQSSTGDYNSQQQQNHNSADSFQNFDLNSHNFNNHQSNHHIQPFTTRYFSQFSNQETEFLYNMSTSTGSNRGASLSATSIPNGSTSTPTTHSGPSNVTSFSSLSSVSHNLNASNQNYVESVIRNDNDSNMQEKVKTEITDYDQESITATAIAEQQHQQGNEEQEPEPEIDIVINNVVCSFSVRCHLNLREIALNGFNVEFRRENGMVTMKLRRPYTTASIWSSGRITCTGATSEEQAKIAARRYARCLQKLGFSVRFHNFRVVNVLGTCSMPWAIKIVNFSEKYKKEASYEPELHPGVTYKLKYPKATLKIFSTGSITVTAGSVAHVQAAIEHIFPLVYEFRKRRTPEEVELLRSKNPLPEEFRNDDEFLHSPQNAKRKRPPGCAENDPKEDIMCVSDYEDDD